MPEPWALDSLTMGHPAHVVAGSGGVQWAALLLPLGTAAPAVPAGACTVIIGDVFLASDRVALIGWQASGVAQHWHFGVTRPDSPDLEPAPRCLHLLLRIQPQIAGRITVQVSGPGHGPSITVDVGA
jgi:hypothetical protein